MGGEAFATRNKLNLRMDLAIGRKPDYRPVGYMAHAEGRKSIKQTQSNKVRVISRGRGGDWQRDWVCVCYKGIQHLEKFRYAIAARAVALAVKRSLSEHNKKSKIKLQQQELMENGAR